MPSRYTADLYDGKEITFPDFVMQCARQMGYLLEMIEEPFSVPIPEEFKPDPYHASLLERSKAEMKAIQGWSDIEAERQAQISYAQALLKYEAALADKASKRARYEEMLAKVTTWTPPTPNHQGLKDFMVSQLQESIERDCSTAYLYAPKRLSGAAFKEQQLEAAIESVSYHSMSDEEAINRASERTQWVQELRRSLWQNSI